MTVGGKLAVDGELFLVYVSVSEKRAVSRDVDKRAETREQRTKNKAQRTKNKEQRTKTRQGRWQRAESREQREAERERCQRV